MVDVVTIKARWSPSILSAMFSHLNLKLSISQAQSGLEMLGYGALGGGGGDDSAPGGRNSNSALQLSAIQGTFDQPSSEMTVVQLQSLVSSLDCDADVTR